MKCTDSSEGRDSGGEQEEEGKYSEFAEEEDESSRIKSTRVNQRERAGKMIVVKKGAPSVG